MQRRKRNLYWNYSMISNTLLSIRGLSRQTILQERTMKKFTRLALTSLAAAGAALCGTANAADITRLTEPALAGAPFVEAVAVPPGYTTYYVSGSVATPQTPAAGGKPAAWGDIGYQTKSTLEGLKKTMAKLGLTLGDVVQAHVFMAPDPAMKGGMDFAGMNKAWLTEFGTKQQPNKPARAAFKVAALAGDGPLLEIEFIAVKKAK
jgi:enamine deaminase RidA (YjgF/YER057c/UK114 family)